MTAPNTEALEAARVLARAWGDLDASDAGGGWDDLFVQVVAPALDAARRRGIEAAARWHDEQVTIAMGADKVAQTRAIARLSLAEFHEVCAAEIRALAPPQEEGSSK